VKGQRTTRHAARALPSWAASCLAAILAVLGTGTNLAQENSITEKKVVDLKPASALTLDEFIRYPNRANPIIGPDGSKVVSLETINGRLAAVLTELDSGQTKIVASFNDAELRNVRWLNPEMLLVVASQKDEDRPDKSLLRSAIVNLRTGETSLAAAPRMGNDDPAYSYNIVAVPAENRDANLVISVASVGGVHRLYNYNTKTGFTRRFPAAPLPRIVRWFADASGDPRLAVGLEADKNDKKTNTETWWYRQTGETAWQPIFERRATETAEGVDARSVSVGRGPVPIGVTASGPIVLSLGENRTASVHRYDVTRKALGEQLATGTTAYTAELDGSVDGVASVVAHTEIAETTYLDSRMQKLIRGIDRALPNTVNSIVTEMVSHPYRLIVAKSDSAPTVQYALDLNKGSLKRIASVQPWLNSVDLPARQQIRFPARDGVELFGWLTLPPVDAAATKPIKDRPVIVLMPTFYPLAPTLGQSAGEGMLAAYFASRGYVVIEAIPRWLRLSRTTFAAGTRPAGLQIAEDLDDTVLALKKAEISDLSSVSLLGLGRSGAGALSAAFALSNTQTSWRCVALHNPDVTISDGMFSVAEAFARRLLDASGAGVVTPTLQRQLGQALRAPQLDLPQLILAQAKVPLIAIFTGNRPQREVKAMLELVESPSSVRTDLRQVLEVPSSGKSDRLAELRDAVRQTEMFLNRCIATR
jgi:hypothetical protein